MTGGNMESLKVIAINENLDEVQSFVGRVLDKAG